MKGPLFPHIKNIGLLNWENWKSYTKEERLEKNRLSICLLFIQEMMCVLGLPKWAALVLLRQKFPISSLLSQCLWKHYISLKLLSLVSENKRSKPVNRQDTYSDKQMHTCCVTYKTKLIYKSLEIYVRYHQSSWFIHVNKWINTHSVRYMQHTEP